MDRIEEKEPRVMIIFRKFILIIEIVCCHRIVPICSLGRCLAADTKISMMRHDVWQKELVFISRGRNQYSPFILKMDDIIGDLPSNCQHRNRMAWKGSCEILRSCNRPESEATRPDQVGLIDTQLEIFFIMIEQLREFS
jgi:hypothetical protein